MMSPECDGVQYERNFVKQFGVSTELVALLGQKGMIFYTSCVSAVVNACSSSEGLTRAAWHDPCKSASSKGAKVDSRQVHSFVHSFSH